MVVTISYDEVYDVCLKSVYCYSNPSDLTKVYDTTTNTLTLAGTSFHYDSSIEYECPNGMSFSDTNLNSKAYTCTIEGEWDPLPPVPNCICKYHKKVSICKNLHPFYLHFQSVDAQ